MNKEVKAWIVTNVIKSIRTMSQTAIGIIGAGALMSDVNWLMCGSAALLSGIVCVLMSLSTLPDVNNLSDDESDGE